MYSEIAFNYKIFYIFVFMETIGEKIRRIRKSKGISQNAVSDICGITQPSYANIESNKTQNITIEIGKGIAKALDVSFNELFEIEILQVNSDIEKLLNEKEDYINQMREKYENHIKSLENTIKDKEFIINAISIEKRLYKENVIMSIETRYNHKLSELEKKLRICTNENERKHLELSINQLENSKKMEYDNFIYIGFLDEEDLKRYYSQLQEHYNALGAIQNPGKSEEI